MRDYTSGLYSFSPIVSVFLFVALGIHIPNANAADADQATKVSCPAQATRLTVSADGSMRLNGIPVSPETYVSVASTIKGALPQTCLYIDPKAQGESIRFVESITWTHLMAHVPVFLCEDVELLQCAPIKNASLSG